MTFPNILHICTWLICNLSVVLFVIIFRRGTGIHFLFFILTAIFNGFNILYHFVIHSALCNLYIHFYSLAFIFNCFQLHETVTSVYEKHSSVSGGIHKWALLTQAPLSPNSACLGLLLFSNICKIAKHEKMLNFQVCPVRIKKKSLTFERICIDFIPFSSGDYTFSFF